MVHLVGVHHAGRNPLTGEGIYARASNELGNLLSTFPKGTRVGLEYLSQEDYKFVQANFKTSASKIKEGVVEGATYPREVEVYWRDLESRCRNLGLDPIYLDNKKLFLEMNKLVIEQGKFMLKSQREFGEKSTENDFNHGVRVLKYNEQMYRYDLFIRRINEIERDNSLLDSIASFGVDVAIVGAGHSDYWFCLDDDLGKRGIVFDKYSTDLMEIFGVDGEHFVRFTEDGSLSPDTQFKRDNLLRSLSVVEKGRIAEDKTPSYVGTWNLETPSVGYFEIFFDPARCGAGMMQDCLGVGNFELWSKSGEFLSFSKRYVSGLALSEALGGRVDFKLRKVNEGEFFGDYVSGNTKGHVFMVEKPRIKPADLTIKFLKFLHRE